MRSLRELQRQFGDALLRSTSHPEFAPGFGVYVGNVFGNWTKALAAAYPIVRKIVGEPFFDALACAYAREHPSTGADLNEFGARLPDFVTAYPDMQDLPYLADVARMEWSAHRIHFAADSGAFAPAHAFADAPVQYSRIPLRLAASASLMVSRWPLGRLWSVHQDGYIGEPSVDFECAPEHILIYRPRWRAVVESVRPGDYRLLAEAGLGATLGDALAAAMESDHDFDAAAAFARWAARGVIAL